MLSFNPLLTRHIYESHTYNLTNSLHEIHVVQSELPGFSSVDSQASDDSLPNNDEYERIEAIPSFKAASGYCIRGSSATSKNGYRLAILK